MNVLNIKRSKILVFLAMAAGSLMLAACGPAGEIKPVEGNWDKEASAYFNANMPAMNNLPGKVYDFQNIRTERGVSGLIVWIDGAKIKDLRGTSNISNPGTGRIITAYQGVRLRWSKADGYKVDTGRVGLEATVKMFKGDHEEFWKVFL